MSFLGIDLGTGSLKLAIVDEAGHGQAAASVAYAIGTPLSVTHAFWIGMAVSKTGLPRRAPDDAMSPMGNEVARPAMRVRSFWAIICARYGAGSVVLY